MTLPPEAARSYFRYGEIPNFPPRYNIAPTQPIPIVRLDGAGSRRFALVRWGFIPSFVKDMKAFPLIITAKAEGIDGKPSFRAAVRRRRCLIIADGFYEWRQDGSGSKAPKQPFLMRRPDGGPMAFAGLYETWQAAEGSEIETACIITTEANATLAAIHARMPVILAPPTFDVWLDPAADLGAALALLRPAPENAVGVTAISTRVNRVAHDDALVQAPL